MKRIVLTAAAAAAMLSFAGAAMAECSGHKLQTVKADTTVVASTSTPAPAATDKRK